MTTPWTFCRSLPGASCRGRVSRSWLESPLPGLFAVPQRSFSREASLALRLLLLKRRVRSHGRGGRVRERRDRDLALGPLAAICPRRPDPGEAPPEALPPGHPHAHR